MRVLQAKLQGQRLFLNYNNFQTYQNYFLKFPMIIIIKLLLLLMCFFPLAKVLQAKLVLVKCTRIIFKNFLCH